MGIQCIRGALYRQYITADDPSATTYSTFPEGQPERRHRLTCIGG